MLHRISTVFAAALLLLVPAASQASLSTYGQDFETLVQSDPQALANDGWVVYGNVFTPAHVFLYGYGTFPAPNPGGGFSAIASGQGGTPQGAQQLSIYSDYNNQDHASGNLIESNVFHEQTIGAADAGTQWTFQFDAKLGNLTGATTALAFIKTIDPAHGYAQTAFNPVPMTGIPTTWSTYTISISIGQKLVGQLMQFGFANTATHFEGSGVFYDNIFWFRSNATDVPGATHPNSLELSAAAPNPFTSSMNIEYALAERGSADVSVYDITGRRVATLFHGEAEAGAHVAKWDGRSADGRLAPAGVYRCVLNTAAGRQARSLVLNR